jgi:predicted DNA-binding antitoxin AbrB/MazE fold protein
MQKTFEAVYEDGVLRPLETLELADRQHVQVTIPPIHDLAADVAAYFEPAEWEMSKQDDMSLAEVRRALSSIRGALSEAVVASRDERL